MEVTKENPLRRRHSAGLSSMLRRGRSSSRHSKHASSSFFSVSSSGVSFFLALSFPSRFSITARSRKISSFSMISQSLIGSMLPSGCSTVLFAKHLMTCIRASASATNERKELPRPSPFPAPLDSPARSTNSTCAGVTFLGLWTSTRKSNLLSGTSTTALLGSVLPPA